MNPGFFQTNFFPTDFWHEDFWPDFGGLTTAAVHIFSTGTVDPVFISDSGNNVLMNGSLETNGDIYTNNIFLPDATAIFMGDLQNEASIFWFDASSSLSITSIGITILEAATAILLHSPLNRIGDASNYIQVDDSGIQTFVGTAAVNGLRVKATRVTSSPYVPLTTDDDIFVDTDGGAIIINLPAGIEGKKYRVINTGSAGNDVTIAPNLAELLTGVNASRTLSDGSVIILTYEPTEGWW